MGKDERKEYARKVFMEKPIHEILKSGFTFGEEEELIDEHIHDGKFVRWQYNEEVYEPETQCCGKPKMSKAAEQQREAKDLVDFENQLFKKLKEREAGLNAWRKI
jgi:hypothetical protein